MNGPAIIRAEYTEWKMVKTRSALVLCFEVPLEHQAAVQAALGTPLPNTSTPVAIARLVDQPAKEPIELPAFAPLSQVAGILCAETDFHRWLETTGSAPIKDVHAAANELRRRCGVDTRRDLDRNEAAGATFREIRAAYQRWLNAATTTPSHAEQVG